MQGTTAPLSDSLTAVPYGISQVSCQHNKVLFEKNAAIRSGSESKNYIPLYPESTVETDLGIRLNEPLYTLRRPFRSMGGGGDYKNINNPFGQEPYVASSLNGLVVPKRNEVVDFERILATKDQKRRDRLIKAGIKKIIRPFGFSIKHHKTQPRPDAPRDNPLAQLSGPLTVLNTGIEEIFVGDLIKLEPPLFDQAETCTRKMFGQTKTKRSLIVAPFRGPETHDVQSVREALNVTNKRVKANDFDHPEKAENVDPMLDGEVFSLVDYTKKVMLHTYAYAAAATTLGAAVTFDPRVAVHEGLYKDAQQKIYNLLYKPGDSPPTMNVFKYGAVTPQRYVELLAADILPMAISDRVSPATDNLMQAIVKSFEEEKTWIVGVALEAASPGSNFLMNSGFSRA